MKIYRFSRKGSKAIPYNTITVNDGKHLRTLNLRNDVCNHSPDGGEWGYCGSGPAQLALGVMCDYFDGDTEKALRYYKRFKEEIVAEQHDDTWAITTGQIDGWLLCME